MRLRFTVAVCALLAGCATNPAAENLQRFAATQKPLAENGTLKWSEYYERLYNLSMLAGAPGEFLGRVNEAIRSAQQYESGAISKEEFDYRQRALKSEQVSVDQHNAQVRRAQAAAMVAAGLQSMQISQPHVPAQHAPVASPTPIVGFLQTQSVNGLLRYCRYSNGMVNTISSMSLCPLSTGQ